MFALRKRSARSSVDKREPKVRCGTIYPENSLYFNGF
jgi:hypothetical protein